MIYIQAYQAIINLNMWISQTGHNTLRTEKSTLKFNMCRYVLRPHATQTQRNKNENMGILRKGHNADRSCVCNDRKGQYPVSILYKSIAGRYRPVRVADGPITARYRFIKNATWGTNKRKETTYKELHLYKGR